MVVREDWRLRRQQNIHGEVGRLTEAKWSAGVDEDDDKASRNSMDSSSGVVRDTR